VFVGNGHLDADAAILGGQEPRFNWTTATSAIRSCLPGDNPVVSTSTTA
jgi:hypothetical protein